MREKQNERRHIFAAQILSEQIHKGGNTLIIDTLRYAHHYYDMLPGLDKAMHFSRPPTFPAQSRALKLTATAWWP